MMISFSKCIRMAGLLVFLLDGCHAFVPKSSSSTTMLQRSKSTTADSSSQLQQSSSDTSDGGGGGLFGGLFGGSKQQPAGPQVVLDIPAKDVKIGALRFLMQIYLVGEQNKPQPNSWFTKQGDDGSLDVYYQDGTGMLSLDFTEYSIQATRHGQTPSLQYMLQESCMLHGILDELRSTAFEVDESIEEEKRLLRFSNPNVIQEARDKLPARKADE